MSANANTTMNGTTNGTRLIWDCYYIYSDTDTKIAATLIYSLIFVVSMVGNIFIAVVVFKTKAMRRPINFLIVNMAMSDLLFPIFLFPRIVTSLYVDSWLISDALGLALCKLLNFLADSSAAVSIQSLVLIAVDRFGAVVFPLRSSLISSKLCRFFILATWIVAMAINSPYLFAYKLVDNQGKLACERRWNEAFGESSSFKNYFLAMAVVFFYIPLVLIGLLYEAIYSKIESQVMPGEHSANAVQQRLKRERKVLKMAVAIVFSFAVCWFPYSVACFLAHAVLGLAASYTVCCPISGHFLHKP